VLTITDPTTVPVRAAINSPAELRGNETGNWIPPQITPDGARPAKRHATSLETFDPVRLFSCSRRWHGEHEAAAGWELVQALRSENPRAKAIAAELLARTENAHLPKHAVRRIGSARHAAHRPNLDDKVDGMKVPYGLQVAESCADCKGGERHVFCGLSPQGLEVLDSTRRPSTFPGDALLFVEGHAPRGAFVLCAGRIKLSTTSREGKILIWRIAGAGEVIGLSATISGKNHELTAETLGPCNVNFLERKALLSAIEHNAEFGLRASLALSREFQDVYRDVHDLMLARSSAGKLARLLLSWTNPLGKSQEGAEIRIPTGLTHEEMAQRIGSSRETVTRLLGSMKKRELIRIEGSTLVVRNRTALEALAG
jgi:CRP/FNR family transcriptional regulator, cyclic AMP receptor protein